MKNLCRIAVPFAYFSEELASNVVYCAALWVHQPASVAPSPPPPGPGLAAVPPGMATVVACLSSMALAKQTGKRASNQYRDLRSSGSTPVLDSSSFHLLSGFCT